MGNNPEQFFPRFRALNFKHTLTYLDIEQNPSCYGRQNGPAGDFAESFRMAIALANFYKEAAPRRFAWLEQWKISLAVQSEKTAAE